MSMQANALLMQLAQRVDVLEQRLTKLEQGESQEMGPDGQPMHPDLQGGGGLLDVVGAKRGRRG